MMGETAKVFAETILAELVAAFILLMLGGFLSKRARWVLTATLGRMLNVDVEYVFRTKKEAEEDVRQELDRASFIYLLTGRGTEFQRETFANALGAQTKRAKHRFRVLLPNTQPKDGGPNWTAEREKEISLIDSAFGSGILAEQIETNAKFLSRHVDSGMVDLKRFNCPHIGRILITDRVVYFSPYRRDAHGRDSLVIKYRRGGEMYDCFRRLFTQLWEHG